MSKPISKGDLVMVVRGCTCGKTRLGRIYRVSYIQIRPCYCGYCGLSYALENVAMRDISSGMPLSWLKRLDPDALKDDVPSAEELTA